MHSRKSARSLELTDYRTQLSLCAYGLWTTYTETSVRVKYFTYLTHHVDISLIEYMRKGRKTCMTTAAFKYKLKYLRTYIGYSFVTKLCINPLDYHGSAIITLVSTNNRCMLKIQRSCNSCSRPDCRDNYVRSMCFPLISFDTSRKPTPYTHITDQASQPVWHH